MKRFGLFMLTSIFTAAFSITAFAAEAVPSDAKVRIMGREIDFEAYTIDGYTYFKLRDLVGALGFDVVWDAAAKVISVSEKGTEAPAAEETPVVEETPESVEEQVLELVNEARAQEGLPTLKMDEKVMEAAAVRAEEMLELYDHSRPDGRSCFTALKEAGANYRAAGENIAYGYPTAEDVMEGWMNSKGHRENILNRDFDKIGIGYQPDGNYWVQMFIG